jgi:hypothetical protein
MESRKMLDCCLLLFTGAARANIARAAPAVI